MSILDVKHQGLFRVDFLRFVLDLDHQAIADYTIEHQKKWNSYTSYHNTKINEDWKQGLPGREKFEKDVYEAADEYIERTGRRKFDEKTRGSYLDYWASIYRKGDHHGSHNHPNTLIAGTYYPQTGPESNPIVLEAPWRAQTMHDTISGDKTNFSYRPNAGDMIMWPSWVWHRVNPQKVETDIDRIAISFNLDYGRYHMGGIND